MHAQEELKNLFTEIEQSSDRALAGLQKVRATTKLEAFPSNRQMAMLQAAFLGALASLMALWISRGA
ncbi:hypothetical protein [uncultured Roseibium sp.]|uniref:hypothetical protein n=1 Tax=uncultured Roseibium sp. TaxID=1936171 RepID=UPI003217A5A0